jgi:hypothetical protein
MVTTAPLAARNIASASRTSRNVLVRLVVSTEDHSASDKSAIGLRIMKPALQIRASSRSSVAAIERTSAATAASSPTSHCAYRPPVGAEPTGSRSATITRQPSRSRCRAMAAPMPFAPPVTSATRGCRSAGTDDPVSSPGNPAQPLAASSACDKSPRISSICSKPTDNRTYPGVTPVAACSDSVSWEWVVLAGWIARLRASPMLATW